jgi:hypothetical protein
MRHPSEFILALFAGGDLRGFNRWRIARHLDRCGCCRAEVDRYEQIRDELVGLAELPQLNWDQVAAEMKANIRLGVVAGECVRAEAAPRPRIAMGLKPLVAAGCVAVLMVAGVFLQHPKPRLRAQGTVLEAVQDGIAVRTGDQMLTLVNTGSGTVTYTAGAQGSMRARYVDSETGQVTIHHVYVQ